MKDEIVINYISLILNVRNLKKLTSILKILHLKSILYVFEYDQVFHFIAFIIICFLFLET